MNDFGVNLAIIIIVLSSFFYANNKYRRSKKKKKKFLFKSWFISMTVLTFVFYLFVLITSIIRYSDNILWNIVFITIITATIYLILHLQYKKKFLQKTSKDIIPHPVKAVLLILFVMLLFNFTTITNQLQFISKGELIPFDELQKGDILVRHKGYGDSVIPGYWSHIGLIANKSNGTYNIIESTTKGSRIVTFEKFKGKSEVSMVRIRDANESTREEAVGWASTKVGLPYNFNILNKRIEGNSYYCSELIWAAYKRLGIDIDKNPGFHIKYANSVSPQEIFGDDDVEIFRIRYD